VVQHRGNPDVSRASNPLRHILDELIDPSLVLNDHHSGKRALPIGDAHIQFHILAIELDALPR
jgi:hypothetical protein